MSLSTWYTCKLRLKSSCPSMLFETLCAFERFFFGVLISRSSKKFPGYYDSWSHGAPQEGLEIPLSRRFFAQITLINCLEFMFTSSLPNHAGCQNDHSRNNTIFSIQFTFSRSKYVESRHHAFPCGAQSWYPGKSWLRIYQSPNLPLHQIILKFH